MSTAEVLEAEVVDETEVTSTSLSLIENSEINQQIATARRFPRSIKRFINKATEMATISEDVAGECFYSLPRGGKVIEGPSARLAEIVASAWGNCRAAAKVVSEDDRFVTSVGGFFDVETNVAITYEVKRRITDKNNRKYNDDMVGVTGNAACSIALRNAVFKGVPKAFWNGIYQAARKCAIGDAKTLAARRTEMIQAFAKMSVKPEQIFTILGVAGEADVTLDHLGTMRGLYTAIKDGDTTVDDAFSGAPVAGGKVQKSAVNEKLNQQQTNDATAQETAPPAAADDLQFDELGVRLWDALGDPKISRDKNAELMSELYANRAKMDPKQFAALEERVKANTERLKKK